MKGESKLLHVFNYLARLVGAVWVLGGLLAIVSAIVDSERRFTYLVLGALFLIAGIALVFAKSAVPADLERIRQRLAAATRKNVPKE